MTEITRKHIAFRAGRPVDVNSKCSQCAGDCKQHKAFTFICCPAFASRKKNIRHPSVGEAIKNSPLESVKSSVHDLACRTDLQSEANLGEHA